MNHSFRRVARMFVWSAMALAGTQLAGCGLFRGEDKPPREIAEAAPVVRSQEELSCPFFSMVGDTQDLVIFDDKGTTIDNLRYHATLDEIEGKCEYTHRNAGLTLTVKIATSTIIGPAIGQDDKVEVPVFIAATRGDRSIVNKTVQVIELAKSTGVDKRWLADVSFMLPDDVEGPELDVLIGFQLTPAQLKRNREFR